MHDQPCYAMAIDQLREDKQGSKQNAPVSNRWVSLRPRPWEKPPGQYWSSTGTVGKGWRLNKADVLCVSRRVDVTPPRRDAFSQRDRLVHRAAPARSRGQTIHFINGRNQRTVGETRPTSSRNILSTRGGSALTNLGGFTCSAFCICRAGHTHTHTPIFIDAVLSKV